MRGDSNAGPTLPSSDLSGFSDYLPPASRHGSGDTIGVSAHPHMNSTLSDSPSGRSATLEDDASALSTEVRHGSSLSALAATADDMAALDDQRLHTVGVAALAAVAQY